VISAGFSVLQCGPRGGSVSRSQVDLLNNCAAHELRGSDGSIPRRPRHFYLQALRLESSAPVNSSHGSGNTVIGHSARIPELDCQVSSEVTVIGTSSTRTLSGRPRSLPSKVKDKAVGTFKISW
jgi:hypothetical protein